MIKYFHELAQKELNRLVDNPDYTWGQCKQDYPKPPWCVYSNAVGPLGCMSLVYLAVTKSDNGACAKCDHNKEAICSD